MCSIGVVCLGCLGVATPGATQSVSKTQLPSERASLIVAQSTGSQPRVVSSCAPDELNVLEVALRSIDARIAEVSSQLSSLQEELRELQSRAGETGSGPLNRLQEERLLRESRSMTQEINGLRESKRTLESERAPVSDQLRGCYTVMLDEELGRAVISVQDGLFDEARTHMHVADDIEGRLALVTPGAVIGPYPSISTAFLEASRGDGEVGLLFDTIQDLIERAQRDSTRLAHDLGELRARLEHKTELMELMQGADEGGGGAGGFFDDFGYNDTVRDVEGLRREERVLAADYQRARDAIAYYRERVDALETIVAEAR